MFDPEKLLGNIVGQALGGVFGGRRGRKSSMFSTGNMATKATLGLGALGIAMAAYEHYKQQQPAPVSAGSPPPPPLTATLERPNLPSAPLPPPPPPPAADLSALTSAQSESVLLIRAMIAAAAADGTIDTDERERILARSGDAELNDQTRQFLQAELAVPRSADDIAALTRPGMVESVFVAALIAAPPDTEAEVQFLDRLGNGLGLTRADQDRIKAGLIPN